MNPAPARPLITAAMLVAVLLIAIFPLGQAHGQSRSKPSARKVQSAAVYSCPMHPEVKAAKASRCPKCGLTLRLTRDVPSATTPVKGIPIGGVPVPPVEAKMTIPDVEVLDQDGRKIHFYRDLVKGRVVVINFIFTTCTTICPPLGATFARVQKDLGERAGRDVSFISISVDPATDTPERLKAWGAKFKAGPAWTFVTGQRPVINDLLRALGAATASPQDHSPTVLIGNERRGQWTRSYGLAPPSQLVKIINEAIEGRLEMNKQEAVEP